MNGGAIVLDANLLVLFIVGSARLDLIGRHKRLKAFTVEDFELLKGLSNLMAQIDDPARTQIRETFRQVMGATEEEYVPSRVAASTDQSLRLGLS